MDSEVVYGALNTFDTSACKAWATRTVPLKGAVADTILFASVITPAKSFFANNTRVFNAIAVFLCARVVFNKAEEYESGNSVSASFKSFKI